MISCVATLEGKEIKAKVKPKEKAEQMYLDAIKEKKTAFLLQELQEDIFHLKIGHLSAGAGCQVKISYMTELMVDSGKTRLTVPTTIAPRYIPHTETIKTP